MLDGTQPWGAAVRRQFPSFHGCVTNDPTVQARCNALCRLGHGPTAEEREVAVQTLLNLEAEFAALSNAAEQPQDSAEQALAVLCHTLMNSAAFLFVD